MSLISWSSAEPAPWMVLANSTCCGGEVALGVLGEQLGEHEQAVQRGAQLVRHVGEELGLVARGDRELLGALLQGAPGLLDLEVLDLDRPVLLGEQRGLVLQLGVGPAQLLLLALQLVGALLQLGGEPLRLGQQVLGAGVGDDRVHRDADGLDELGQEVEVDLAELVEGGQLQHAEHLVLEQDRQHHDLRRGRLLEPGVDGEVSGGHVVEHDLLALQRRLADDALADARTAARGLAARAARRTRRSACRSCSPSGSRQVEGAVAGPRPAGSARS